MADVNDNLPEVFATETAEAYVEEGHGGAPTHSEPELLGLAPYQWVSIAMAVLLLFAFGYAKVHRTISRGLDARIAAIRENLDEAKTLRAEAEALREEYAAKIAGAEADADAMLVNARKEADGIVAKAETDTAAMIARRERMAADKIASAERQAVAELRAKAAEASTRAAAGLIAEKHDAVADRALADEVIANI